MLNIREIEVRLPNGQSRRVNVQPEAGARTWHSDAIVAVRRGGGRTIYPAAIHLSDAEVAAGAVELAPSHLAPFRGLAPTVIGWAARPDIGWFGDVLPTADRANWDPDAQAPHSVTDSLSSKLHPSRFTAMSGKMAAIVGCILGESWTRPPIRNLTITSDGGLLANDGNEFIGSADDLDRNLARLIRVAGLTPAEKATFARLRQARIEDWRRPRS